jgi:hypothetical protein
VKAAARWRPEFGAPLKALVADGVVTSAFGVYTGSMVLKDGPIRVLPLAAFLEAVAKCDVIG